MRRRPLYLRNPRSVCCCVSACQLHYAACRGIALKQMFQCKFLYLNGPELYTGGKYSTCIFLVCCASFSHPCSDAKQHTSLPHKQFYLPQHIAAGWQPGGILTTCCMAVLSCRAITGPGETSSWMLLLLRGMHRCSAGVQCILPISFAAPASHPYCASFTSVAHLICTYIHIVHDTYHVPSPHLYLSGSLSMSLLPLSILTSILHPLHICCILILSVCIHCVHGSAAHCRALTLGVARQHVAPGPST